MPSRAAPGLSPLRVSTAGADRERAEVTREAWAGVVGEPADAERVVAQPSPTRSNHPHPSGPNPCPRRELVQKNVGNVFFLLLLFGLALPFEIVVVPHHQKQPVDCGDP